jgi:hypothetical protein
VSEKTISRLWYLTGILALLLLIGTASLVTRGADLDDVGFDAALNRSGGPVVVREGPTGLDPIITILPQGSPVFVVDATESEGRNWVLIQADEIEGWVPAEEIRVSP